jgi:hypothetical protein
MKRVKLYLLCGLPDHLGNVWEEDRYVVLEDGMDIHGEHYSLTEVSDIIRDNHEFRSEVGTYAEYDVAMIIREKNNAFFKTTNQALVSIVCPLENSHVCSVKIFKL